MDKFEGEDLYSFDNSSNKLNDGETSFDLNSFSSRSTSNSKDPNPKKVKSKASKKQKTLKIILTAFLVCLIRALWLWEHFYSMLSPWLTPQWTRILII